MVSPGLNSPTASRIALSAILLGFSSFSSPSAAAGPDIVPVKISSVVNHGQDGIFQGYSVGFTTCNLGDTPIFVCDADSPDCDATDHPIIVVNLYRVRFVVVGQQVAFSRFEQIGMSWVRHLTTADNVSQGGCGSCQPPPLGNRQLGVGCADTLSGADASVRPLARRSEVNPTTVSFPFPFTSPVPTSPSEQRLRVQRTDLDPATNSFARYFLEIQVLAADDLAAGNSGNNFAYREVLVDPQSLDLILSGLPVTGRPAIFAWRDIDPRVQIAAVEVPGSDPVERFFVARRYFQDFDDFDNYFYVLRNINSDLAVRRWSVVFSGGLDFGVPTATTIPHHSGEPYSASTWVWDSDLPSFTHMSMFTSTFAMDPNANALRWGTAFSFRFIKDVGLLSMIAEESFELFKPGPVGKVDFTFSELPPELIFSSDFESGDLSGWTSSVP